MKNESVKFKTSIFRQARFTLLALAFGFSLLAFRLPVKATTTSPTPSPIASPSAQPTTVEDEKVKEIREAIKEKVNEIKEKIEKKAYVGTISQITDSTLTLENFRGKQRVRLTEETIIIGTNKKEIKAKDLALEDKIIAMGNITENEILEAKRILVVAKPKTLPPKRLIFMGQITKIDAKNSLLTFTDLKDNQTTLTLKVEQTTNIFKSTPKTNLKFKDLGEGQKIIVVYPQPAAEKTAIAKTLFVLP